MKIIKINASYKNKQLRKIYQSFKTITEILSDELFFTARFIKALEISYT